MLKHRIAILLISALAVAFGLLGIFGYLAKQKEVSGLQTALKVYQRNEKALQFLQMFVNDVLRADDDVSFETRLRLENAVRELDDQKILLEWQAFVDSKTEEEAQGHVKNLLSLLVDKIALKKI